MENHDTIFEKIKAASLNQQASDFASMEKVWSRVEDKLDHKVLKKQNKLWKKIAVAASFLLVFTVSYQIFKPETKTVEISVPPKPKIPTPVVKEIQTSIAKQAPETIEATKKAASNPDKITTKPVPAEIHSQDVPTGTIDKQSQLMPAPEKEILSRAEMPAATSASENDLNENKKFRSARIKQAFAARSLKRATEISIGTQADMTPNDARTVVQKSSPLIVIDGQAITAKDEKKAFQEGITKIDPDAIENIVILKEPLYIINGSYYSEQEMFGPNPTSPYNPLSQQEIESLSILQGEKAIAAYGKKGEKGVVIITTKNGKPVKAPQHKE